MYKIEDLADWNSNYKINAMGRGTETQRKSAERIRGKLLQRQFMIHKYMNNKQIQKLIDIQNNNEKEIERLEREQQTISEKIEMYLMNNEKEIYAPYIKSNQLYNSDYSNWLERNEL